MDDFFLDIKTADEDRITYKYLSGGEWLESSSGELIDIKSPIDESLVGRIQAMTTKEIDIMLTAAAVAQETWRKSSLKQREKILKKAACLLEEKKEIFINLLVREIGKTLAEAKGEVERTVDVINYTAEQKDWGKVREIKGEDFPRGPKNKVCKVFREPLGVVLAIVPFNYPLNLAATKIAPALLCGNAVVVKGPTQGSITTLHLVEIFKQAGVWDGAISLVSGRGSEIGDFMTTHELIDMIAFTGSSKVGKDLAVKAGLVPLLLELGGKDAAIVFADADLELAAEEVVKGAFSFAGQRCTAIKKVLVSDDVADEFIEILVAKTKELFGILGDPRDPKIQLGPVISDVQAEYLESLIRDAQDKGAVEVLGGRRKGKYIPATILDNVNGEMRIAWEEQFGPILPITRFSDPEEAIGIVNASEYGLEASIFTQDEDLAKGVARSLEVGVVQINARPQRWPDHFPFLGVKDSGVGVQGVSYSIEAMTRIKGVVENR